MSNSVEYESYGQPLLAEATAEIHELLERIEDLEKSLWCCSTEGVSLVEQLKEKDQRIKELEEKIITLRCIGKKYKNKLVEINELLLDPDY